ncbi:MAG: GTP-binding protein [Candidatus Helarchaeota archaeon]|nr:GTP-binding protein [Candidatus Helarchaeota archaeon]
MTEELITGVIYSQFEKKLGPTVTACYPSELPKEIKNLISLKTINIMIGEDKRSSKSLAVLPFPSINLKGLVRLMEIKDKSRRGGIIESNLTLLYNEANDSIFYKYLSNFESIFNKAIDIITDIEEKNGDKHQIQEELKKFHTEIINLLEDLKNQEFSAEEKDAFPRSEEEELERSRLRFKIIICGDPMVGKTSIILRFTDHAFKRTYISTIGVNITEKVINYKNANIELIIWDLAGQTKFQKMRKHFYKGADAQLLVFDLTSQKTFENIGKWNSDIKRFLKNKKILGYILGNKSDLVDERKVSKKDGLKLGKKLVCDYIETSALNGVNVDEVFYKIGKILYELEENKEIKG